MINDQTNSNLQSSIFKTLAWFDLFNFPLTAKEIHQYLWSHFTEVSRDRPVSYLDIVNTLKTLPGIMRHEGFYCVFGRSAIIQTRKERYIYAERKFKRVLKIVRILRLLPWIKYIGVCNTLGYSNAADDADIDLFIITQKNRVWTTRLFVVGFLRIFHLRPLLKRTGKDHDDRRDKIDANFFIDETALNLESIALPGIDIYLSYWINLLIPLYDVDHYAKKLRTENTWTKSYLPNAIPYQPSYRRNIHATILTRCFTILSIIPESVARWPQMVIMPGFLKELAQKKSTAVIITHNMLKFHDLDKREEYRSKWKMQNES